MMRSLSGAVFADFPAAWGEQLVADRDSLFFEGRGKTVVPAVEKTE